MPKRTLRSLPPEERPFPARGYLWLNLAFVVLCILIYLAAGLFHQGETAGLIPVLCGLILCFAIVSLYDAFFDRIILRRVRESSRPSKADDDRDSRPGSSASGSGGPDTL